MIGARCSNRPTPRSDNTTLERDDRYPSIFMATGYLPLLGVIGESSINLTDFSVYLFDIAEEVADRVHHVCAAIHHHAAATKLFSQPPMPVPDTCWIVPSRRLRKEHSGCPDNVPLVECPSDSSLSGRPATVLCCSSQSPMVLCNFNHLLACLDCYPKRFFRHYIDARFEARDGGNMVIGVRCTDIRAIQIFCF